MMMKHVVPTLGWILAVPLSLTVGVVPAFAQHGQPRPGPHFQQPPQHQAPPQMAQPPQQRPGPAPFAHPAQPAGAPHGGPPMMRQQPGPPPPRGPAFQPHQGPPPNHATGFSPPPPNQGPPMHTERRYPAQPPPPAQAHAWHNQGGWRQGGGWPEHRTWQEHRAQHWDHDHRTWDQRGGYGGRYIPEARFYRHFGNEHFFRIRARPTIYMGYPRFNYGGYGFMVVDPWPEYWTDDWYQTDDVYVDYDDGYYLYNRRYPGVAIALTVVP